MVQAWQIVGESFFDGTFAGHNWVSSLNTTAARCGMSCCCVEHAALQQSIFYFFRLYTLCKQLASFSVHPVFLSSPPALASVNVLALTDITSSPCAPPQPMPCHPRLMSYAATCWLPTRALMVLLPTTRSAPCWLTWETPTPGCCPLMSTRTLSSAATGSCRVWACSLPMSL